MSSRYCACVYIIHIERERDREIFPQRGSILEKKKLDTLAGTLCCVGRGFGCAGRAGLGGGFGALGWVGRGFGYFCVWSALYMSSSCLHDVFVFIFMYISDVYHGA